MRAERCGLRADSGWQKGLRASGWRAAGPARIHLYQRPDTRRNGTICKMSSSAADPSSDLSAAVLAAQEGLTREEVQEVVGTRQQQEQGQDQGQDDGEGGQGAGDAPAAPAAGSSGLLYPQLFAPSQATLNKLRKRQLKTR